ncbi:hypothetical protein FVEN_g11422 [Fusarium venenatum]|nr:hypothetical protein FVEN_g11422 [Fusarium venenatum]
MSGSALIAKANNIIRVLDKDRRDASFRALSNMISTDIAEQTYAQILDGLPTEDSLLEGSPYIEGHPVFELEQTRICERFLEKARRMCATLDPYNMQFDGHLSKSFQDANMGSKEYNIRLVELTLVACHQIVAYFFNLDDRAHNHQLYQNWAQQRRMEQTLTLEVRDIIPPSAFLHTSYTYFHQYPQGLADVVGYWAEGRIFGGVAVFDRGETESDMLPRPKDSLSAHARSIRLISFLLSDPEETTTCPLPIHGTNESRPRWHPYDALAKYHVFRDKYERRLSLEPPKRECMLVNAHWPELTDEYIIAAASARLKEVTPLSPCWHLSLEKHK